MKYLIRFVFFVLLELHCQSYWQSNATSSLGKEGIVLDSCTSARCTTFKEEFENKKLINYLRRDQYSGNSDRDRFVLMGGQTQVENGNLILKLDAPNDNKVAVASIASTDCYENGAYSARFKIEGQPGILGKWALMRPSLKNGVASEVLAFGFFWCFVGATRCDRWMMNQIQKITGFVSYFYSYAV